MKEKILSALVFQWCSGLTTSYPLPLLPSSNLSPSQLSYYGSLANCPAGRGFRLLPGTAPAKALIVGYTPARLEFLKELISGVQNHLPELQILVLLQSEFNQSFKQNMDFFNKRKHISIIKLHSNSLRSLVDWPQDLFSLGIVGTKPKPAMIVHSYGENGDVFVQKEIADACQIQTIFPTPPQQDEGNTLGGNILSLPGKVVVVGSLVNPKVLQFLKTEHQVIEIDTSWLPAGHVDELFFVMPNGRKIASETCPFTVFFASPKLGHQLFEDSRDFSRNRELPPLTLSLKLENLIQIEIVKIKIGVQQAFGCKELLFEPLPVLFNVKNEPNYAEYFSLFSNPINGIALQTLAVIPKQTVPLFSNSIREAFAKHKAEVLFVDTSRLHEWGGEAHCATNVIRSCRSN